MQFIEFRNQLELYFDR